MASYRASATGRVSRILPGSLHLPFAHPLPEERNTGRPAFSPFFSARAIMWAAEIHSSPLPSVSNQPVQSVRPSMKSSTTPARRYHPFLSSYTDSAYIQERDPI